MLEIRDLHVKFHSRDREAVGGVSLTIRDGEILGLVGESGSGKSVTAMSVAGLLPRRQCDYSGQILLDGTELLHADRALLRTVQGRDIGVVFQEPMSAMDPLMRIGDQVGEALLIHTGLSPEERHSRVIEALREAELPDPEGICRQYPHQLSGGMLQRAMIAAAVASRPKLLLLDEPTTALDVTIQAQILELLKELREKEGMSIILITHDLGVVASLADRISVMYGGRIMEDGLVDEIFYHPCHPYTRALLRAIPKPSAGGRERLVAIPGMAPSLLNPPPGCPFQARCGFSCEKCGAEMPAFRQYGATQQAMCVFSDAELDQMNERKGAVGRE